MEPAQKRAGGAEPFKPYGMNTEATRFGACPGGFGLALVQSFPCPHSSLWDGNGYSILWGADEVLSKHVLLTWAWLCRGLQCLIPMAMVNLPQTRLRTMAKPSFGSECEY